MASEFFERLVQDRRDGTAPPQVAQLQEAEIRQGPPPEAEVVTTFSASAVAGAWSCDRCHALVDGRLTPNHADWHRRLGG